MKAKSYKILSECVEAGIESAWKEAANQKTFPPEDFILDIMHDSIMMKVDEYFEFEDSEVI